MKAIIAGDIISSQQMEAGFFLNELDKVLNQLQEVDLFHIYRGDSFQLLIKETSTALLVCLKIKTALKRKGIAARMAIGLGDVELIQNNIAISTGSAFTRSGALLDSLKELKQNIMVSSGNTHYDTYMNTSLQLALTFMDSWTNNGAEALFEVLNHPDQTQQQIGERLGIKQSTASRRLDRVQLKEVQALLELFEKYYFKDINHGTTI
ncbi:winged helix-turn-helix transcriptional regulator [Nonlabens sp. SCSIO 43208]|uniref:SatD family protein n=1 Tax=Nonlabens sp. SCSIO 43208 TaxID=2793009 RepID=UPI003D6A5013